MGSSSLTRKGTQAPCLGSEESQPLDTTRGGPEPSSKGSRSPHHLLTEAWAPALGPQRSALLGWGPAFRLQPSSLWGSAEAFVLGSNTFSRSFAVVLLLRKARDGWKSSEAGLTEKRCWSLSHVRLFVTPWIVLCQPPLSMGFSRQEYWSWLPCPLPGDLPDPGIEPLSLASPLWAGRFFTSSAS